MPDDLLLAVAQREPGQIPHVLGTDAEVGVDAGLGEPCPEPGQAFGPGGAVGIGPGRALALRRRGREVSRLREPTGHM